MSGTPFFVDMRLPEGPLRDQSLRLLGDALKEDQRDVVVLSGDLVNLVDQDSDALPDMIVTGSDQLARATALPMLIVTETGMSLSPGLAVLEPVSTEQAVEKMRALFVRPADELQEVEALWGRIASARLPRLALRLWYPLLMLVTVGRGLRKHEILPRSRNFDALASRPDPAPEQIALLMRKADALADIYGQKYRSAFVGRFFLSAVVAVSVALTLFVLPERKAVAYAIEFLTSLVIITSFVASNKGDWKGKWLTYRYIGESLRNARAIGRDCGGFLLQNRDYPDDPITAEDRLIDWCARHISRQDDVRSEDERQTELVALIEGQVAYHQTRLSTLTRIEKRLATIGMTAFLGSMTLALVSFSAVYIAPEALSRYLSPIALALGILPAIGAALFAIRVQANFNAEALHSNAVIGRLTAILSRLDGAPLIVVAALRSRFVAMQRAEFNDWRNVQQGRALDLP